MLINYNSEYTLYILGAGIISKTLESLIQPESTGTIKIIAYEGFDKLPDNSQCIIGISDIHARKNIIEKSKYKNIVWPTYIHPTAIVDPMAAIGQGCYIDALSYVMPGAYCNEFALIGPMSMVSHNTILGSNVFLGPRTTLAGSISIGDNVFFGLGSLIKDKITICSNTEFLMSSVVTKNILLPGTYFGNKKISVKI